MNSTLIIFLVMAGIVVLIIAFIVFFLVALALCKISAISDAVDNAAASTNNEQ